jgi:hypothetical protein
MDKLALVMGLQVFMKHSPYRCKHCRYILDECCGPTRCPSCGCPTAHSLNPRESSELETLQQLPLQKRRTD